MLDSDVKMFVLRDIVVGAVCGYETHNSFVLELVLRVHRRDDRADCELQNPQRIQDEIPPENDHDDLRPLMQIVHSHVAREHLQGTTKH